MPWRDGLALGVGGITMGALGGVFVMLAVFPERVPLGYLAGTILSYEVTVTKLGGTQGVFAVGLDRGESLTVAADGPWVPGDRVCVRAVLRGSVVAGFLVAPARCSGL